MNAFSRSFASSTSMAKKVVACSVAATLVASMSYFHLWGAPQAVADDTTVEVRFEIAQDNVEVMVGDKKFTSQTKESYQASTSSDLNFTIKAESPDTELQYTLNIYYVDGQQRALAPRHTERLSAGAAYRVESPRVAGYTTETLIVAGSMFARDHSVYVVYAPVTVPGGDGQPTPPPPGPQPQQNPPTGGGTPTVVTPAPTPAAAPAPAPAATPAPAAPAAEAIADDPTPQAATPRAEAKAQQIEDEATPMGAFDEPHCWVHWVMLIGILLTAVYGIVVVRRRLGLTNEIDDMEKQVLGVEDAETETVAVAGHQAL